MIISRGLRTLTNLGRLNNVATCKQVIRNSHNWNYRKGAPPTDKKLILLAEIAQGAAWWWVLWHIWTEPGHILGEFPYPDASKWTDQELGIPSD